jgi:deoxyribonuclease-4
VDRHEHIGEGCLGLEPFRRLLNDPRFTDVPILIETEKTSRSSKPGSIEADPFDVKNLSTLRALRTSQLSVRS